MPEGEDKTIGSLFDGVDKDTDDKETDDTIESEDSGKTEKTFTQAELEKVLAKRLKRQEDSIAAKYGDYDKLKEAATEYQKLQDANATDAQRWEQERAALITERDSAKTELTKMQRANLIADLATDKGLPKALWKRVQGDDEDSIAEDMDSIINDLGLNKEPEVSKTKTTSKGKQLYGGGGEGDNPDPDIDKLVSTIPRGPQLRIEKPRNFK